MNKRHVGQIIQRQYLDRQNITAEDLIAGTGIEPDTVAGILNGSVAITPENNEKLVEFFGMGTGSRMFLKIQARQNTSFVEEESENIRSAIDFIAEEQAVSVCFDTAA